VDELQVHDHHRPDRWGVFGRDVKSDHAHQQHRAMMVPFWSRKKLKLSTSAPGTGLQIVS
jgi:hypothetical protein